MNRFERYTGGYTYVVTRRFLDKATGSMRVRVRVYEGVVLNSDTIVLDQFKDFDDIHDGDACFVKQVKWARSL